MIIDAKIISLVIFLLSYILFVAWTKRRMYVALTGAVLLILTGTISAKSAFFSVNWNVMGIFVGTLVVAEIFMRSKVPAYLAEVIVDKSRNTAWAILLICILTSIISAFVENVATVLIIAPVAFSLAKKLKINPVNMMIAIAISSNLQGTATLIGDPPSMLLGGFAKMNFLDFFFFHGKPSIFFAVEMGAIASFIFLYFIFRNQKEKMKIIRTERIKSWVPTLFLVSLIILLALSSFFDTDFLYITGGLCMAFGALSLIWEKFSNNGSILRDIKEMDWETTFFLMGIFVIIGSITLTGWIGTASNFLSGFVGKNLLLGYVLIILISVFLSAFIDNVPFLVAMLPLVNSITENIGTSPYLFLFGLLIGTSLGGNITPIGASANIVACGLLRKHGYHVGFWHFVKIGLIFTILAVLASSIFIWFVWH
ncbi:MAG: anion permease [Nanoarchaeota archaeon]|nr:anion permease [Nanoarchaeota archaeon]